MRITAEIEKDAKIFFREKRTLTLLFIMPIMVLLVLGGIFGKPVAEKTLNANLGLCDSDDTETSKLFAEIIANNSAITDYSAAPDCIAFLRDSVNQGNMSAGIIIPAGFENGIKLGKSQNITVFLDNSRIQVSSSIETFLRAATQSTGQAIGIQFINNVWQKLGNADSKLDSLLLEVNISRAKAMEIQAKIGKTADSLNAINVSVITEELVLANKTMNTTLVELSAAKSNITVMQGKIDGYDKELEGTQADLRRIYDALGNITSQLDRAGAGVDCSDAAFTGYCATLASINSTIQAANNETALRLQKINATRQDLQNANITLQEFSANIDAAFNSGDDARKRIENIQKFAALLEENKMQSLATIDDINATAAELIRKTNDLETIIEDGKKQILDITARDPASVISPILLIPEALFGARTYFDFLLPSLLPLVMMFIALFLSSTSVVRDRNSGMLERIYLSQVSDLGYVSKKVISYSFVLSPVAVVLLLVSSVAYGAFSSADAMTLVFLFTASLLVLLAFTALGIFIAMFAESEATAFLASLVIGLPLLFMSGILFPFEFMPSFIAAFAQLTPLAPAITAMQSAMIYHIPNFATYVSLALYGVLFVLMATGAMYVIRRK